MVLLCFAVPKIPPPTIPHPRPSSRGHDPHQAILGVGGAHHLHGHDLRARLPWSHGSMGDLDPKTMGFYHGKMVVEWDFMVV